MNKEKNKKVKLSSTQIWVLYKLADGETLHYITGLNARCYFSENITTVSWPTIFKLEKIGLVARNEKAGKIELTELGATIKSPSHVD